MKKLLTFALFLIMGINSYSQTTLERARKMTDNMAQELALTETQKSDIYNLTLNRLNTLAQLKAKNDKQSEQSYLIERRKFHSDVHQFMNNEQYKKWEQLRTQHIRMQKDGKKVQNPVIDDELEFMNK